MPARTWAAICLGAALAALCAGLASKALGVKSSAAIGGGVGGAVGAVIALQLTQRRSAPRE